MMGLFLTTDEYIMEKIPQERSPFK